MILAGESKQSVLAKELVGDNLVAEAAPFSFTLKSGGEEIRGAPLAYCPDLVGKVLQLAKYEKVKNSL